MDYSIIGIDFGTSATVVKVKNYYSGMNQKECQTMTFNGNSSVPTLIFKDESGKLFFGFEAENQINSGMKGVLYKNFKMELLGDASKRNEAESMIREFFKYLYAELIQNKKQLNLFPETKTYISYPAKWTPEIRSLMKKCAINAGFGTEETVFGESEPTAAIYASILFHIEELQSKHILLKNQPVNIMMLDMGAGTTDIAIFKLKIDPSNKPVIDELITYPTIDNAYLCGGREIDAIIAETLCGYIKSCSENNQVPEAMIKAVYDTVKSWKEKSVSELLKLNNSAGFPGQIAPQLNMLFQYGILKEKPFEKIDRRNFELITKKHWLQLKSLLEDSLKEAQKKLTNFNGAGDIDLIILTGGHSKWYLVSDFILGNKIADIEPVNFAKIKREPGCLLQEKQPQETVAHGLIYKDIPLDVKYTMGNSLWIQYEVGGQKSGLFKVASHNDVLPLKASDEWKATIDSTSVSMQRIAVTYNCFYGTSEKSAQKHSTTRYVSLNSVSTSIVGGTISTIAAALTTVKNVATMQWEQITDDIEDCYKESYEIKVFSDFDILEDATINVNGKINTQFADNLELKFKI